jgi:hypothetical protein
MKTIYYYQTFVNLDKLLTHTEDIDVVIVSSIHFDKTRDQKPGIFLNDNNPYEVIFNAMWTQTKQLSSKGVDIHLMIGGAGGAYDVLFSDFHSYYPLLRKLLHDKPFISGIDLDIEEGVDYNNVIMLVRKIKEDFPHYKLTFAPVEASLKRDGGSMGGFSYKKLYNEIGDSIDWFNTQCYGTFTSETFDSIVQNGYPPEKIVMGMISGDFSKDNFTQALEVVKKIYTKYPDFSGVYDWEYIHAPPNKDDPSEWCRHMKKISNK